MYFNQPMYPVQNNVNMVPNYRYPTPRNPMMNVDVTDYDRPQEFSNYYNYVDQNKFSNAASYEKQNFVKDLVNYDFKNKLFQDPADLIFERNNSQRQWYSTPVGSVPNDQTSFAENLYGREFVCKAGSIYMRYDINTSDDQMSCTGFEGDGKLTNFGQLN